MTSKMYGALVASLSVAALMLAANEAVARSGVAQRGAFASPHGHFHSPGNRAFRHHRRNDGAIFWPGVNGDDYGPSFDQPLGDGAPPSGYTSNDVLPWDWVHRFPPMVARSDRPYVSSCPQETVTVPGRDGKEQTVNVMRCY